MSGLRLFFIAPVFFLSVPAFADFAGAWHVDLPNRGAITSISDEFNVYLIQQGDVVCGFHYGTARERKKMDWGWKDERKPTVYGRVDAPGRVKISLISAHNDTPIEAELVDEHDRLVWNVTDTGNAAALTIPHSVALHRTEAMGFEFRQLKNCDAESVAMTSSAR